MRMQRRPRCPVACAKRSDDNSEPVSRTTLTIAWLVTVIAAGTIGLLIGQYAKLYRAPPPHELGAATATCTQLEATSTPRELVASERERQCRRSQRRRQHQREREAAQARPEGGKAEVEIGAAASIPPGESEATTGATTRAVATQSQCTYARHLTQPRFRVLPESGPGAYAG